MSHDLILANYFKEWFYQHLKINILCTQDFGTEEIKQELKEPMIKTDYITIKNIHDMRNVLEHRMKELNNRLGKEKYGVDSTDDDDSKDDVFSKDDNDSKDDGKWKKAAILDVFEDGRDFIFKLNPAYMK